MIDQILDEFNVIMNVRDCLQLRTNIKMGKASNPDGEGFACKRIADILCL